jgi:hypothetical protein
LAVAHLVEEGEAQLDVDLRDDVGVEVEVHGGTTADTTVIMLALYVLVMLLQPAQ